MDFDGLVNFVQTASAGTYTVGGINDSTNAWWQNAQRTYVAANGIRKELTTMYNNISIGNDHPTLVLTTQNIQELYEDSLSNLLRIMDNKFGDAGFEAIAFKGAAMTFSPSCVATNSYFLNERYLELVVESTADFVMTDWKPIPNQLDRVAQVEDDHSDAKADSVRDRCNVGEQRHRLDHRYVAGRLVEGDTQPLTVVRAIYRSRGQSNE